jgi:hypothetical protein
MMGIAIGCFSEENKADDLEKASFHVEENYRAELN